jgi:hypothetical protein
VSDIAFKDLEMTTPRIPTIDQLQVFLGCCRAGSFAAAAVASA